MEAQDSQTRLQVINPSPNGLYTGVSNALSTITKAEGVGSLWRGISSVALGAGTKSATSPACRLAILTKNIGPAHAVYFATYEAVKQAMGGNMGNEHHPLAAGKSAEQACTAAWEEHN